MHLENLLPLLAYWPIAAALAVLLGGLLFMERRHRMRERLRATANERRYWIAEMAYRARMRAREWLSGTRTLRITYQAAPAAEAAAAEAFEEERRRDAA